MRISRPCLLIGLGLTWLASPAWAEPMFLSRQYTRCTTCHYSPTGGGLLTPYGRSLSRQELSTTGRSTPPPQEPSKGGEEGFLYGLLGDALGPVSVGIDVRPSHLNLDVGGSQTDRNFLMNADLTAAYRDHGWTVYGEVGRQPLPDGSKIDSYEYWVGHQWESGLGFRLGRFLPAYGIRFADHTAYTRSHLGFDKYDQVYGLEISHTSDHQLVELSVGPGFANAVLHPQEDGRQAFTATGRWQLDVGSRSALVVSGLYRDQSTAEARNGGGGVAFGFAPISHLSVWTEADAQFKGGASGTAYTFLNETAFEVYRGVWLKFSPQLRTGYGDTSSGFLRLAGEITLFPRTHWNLGASYYWDKNRDNSLVTKIWLAQLHLYL
jgi:hypothetical protein